MQAPQFPRSGLPALGVLLVLLHPVCSSPSAPATSPSPALPEVVNAMEIGTIQVTSAGLVRRTSPGRTIPVPYGQGTLQVTVRRLFPAPSAVRVRAEPAEGGADAASWRVEQQDPPAPDALAFRLHGGRPGRVVVTLEVPGARQVRFALDVTEVPILSFGDFPGEPGRVLQLGVGDRFVLDLNAGVMREVRVSLTDPSVLQLLRERDDGRPPMFFSGRAIHIENEYQAVRPGRSTLRAYGASGRGAANFDFALDIEVR